jgi:hypothetical protein
MIRRGTGWKQGDMTATPSKYPQGYFKPKKCRWCEEVFGPVAPSHLYCSDACKDNGLADNYYKNTYGSSLKEVESLLESQNNLCFICEEVGFKMNEHVHSPLNVDHCHTTGVVRGLLCHNCNRALGLFKDSVDRLKRAISYLEGVTTIPQGSTQKSVEAHDPSDDGDDIVCSHR